MTGHCDDAHAGRESRRERGAPLSASRLLSEPPAL